MWYMQRLLITWASCRTTRAYIYISTQSHEYIAVSSRRMNMRALPTMAYHHVLLPVYDWASRQNNKMACAPSENSDQPERPPSLIRVFTVHMRKAWVLSYPLSAQGWLWSDWADAQGDLSLRWAHGYFVGFVMRRLIYTCQYITMP